MKSGETGGDSLPSRQFEGAVANLSPPIAHQEYRGPIACLQQSFCAALGVMF